MSELSDAFIKLLDRRPTDHEVQNLYRVRDALGLKTNDALWLVLIALEYHQSLYREVPENILKSASETLTEFRHAANAIASQSLAEARADLARAVAQTAQDVANTMSKTLMSKWISLGTAIAFVCIGATAMLMFYIGSTSGFNDGYRTGYEQIKLEASRDAWVHSYEGQLAYKFAQVGDIHKFAKCTGKGWRLKDGFCTPLPIDGLSYGWVIPR